MVRGQRKDVLADLGARVRDHRHAQGWSQEQFAELAGVHRTYIGAIERGQQNVTVLTLVATTEAISIDPGEFTRDLVATGSRLHTADVKGGGQFVNDRHEPPVNNEVQQRPAAESIVGAAHHGRDPFGVDMTCEQRGGVVEQPHPMGVTTDGGLQSNDINTPHSSRAG